MADEEWIPFEEALDAILKNGCRQALFKDALLDGRIRARWRKVGRREPVEVPGALWAEWVYEQPDRLIPRANADSPKSVGFTTICVSRSDVENFLEEHRAAVALRSAQSHFNEQRWPLAHVLSWIAFRRVEALALSDEEFGLQLYMSMRGFGDAHQLASQEPARELLAVLTRGNLEAIGPDHKALPAAYWDGRSLNPKTWPKVRFHREQVLGNWPPSTEAAASDDKAAAPKKKLTKAERLAAQLLAKFPDGTSLGLKELPSYIGGETVGSFTERTLIRARGIAWPQLRRKKEPRD